MLPPGKESDCELSSESNGVLQRWSATPTNSEAISVATPRLLRMEVFMRAQCRLTFKSVEEVRRDWIAANFSGHILDDATQENTSKKGYASILLCRSKISR